MSHDTLRLLVPILLVGIGNIALNVFSKAAASEGQSYVSAVMSGSFILALLAGCTSLAGLVWVYQSKVALASAILLMGSISIIGGSLVGIFLYGNKLHPVEVALLLVIAVLFGARWVLAR